MCLAAVCCSDVITDQLLPFCGPSTTTTTATLLAVANMAVHANGDQNASVSGRWNDNEHGEKSLADVDLRGVSSSDPPAITETLARKLSSRQVSMIAIGGTIGTGLFLGTGKSLATGGPASMLISYAIVGFIVFMTMLALGEMAAFTPVAGSFCTFAG